MTNQQLFLAVAPIVLSQITLIVVLIFGFLNQNRRIDDIARRLDRIRKPPGPRMEERLTSLEKP